MNIARQIGRLSMKQCLILAVAFFGLGTALLANTVSSPAKRQEALDKAKNLLGDKPIGTSTKNPFNPEGFGEGQGEVPKTGTNSVTTVQTGPRSGRDLLQAIGGSLKPSGFFVLSGEPTLVFGQKRVKAGGLLTITFEGSEYTLEIVSINQPNFTLRLNREEFTRPIK
ncbi:hypothetical protein ESB00_03790 [Oleiharenicola lentus]|uniref:Uncharacterized protein n=1 Tax=Oleiharenicola lentus TaxID=2508720 RepID=A0A4Q1C8A1_9BACT|nr:hypothetical protein [Oleiharenicola lentus]RXK55032.1 hypothetical protein ESB00_03790 [Oleiharenicola lentus]